MRVFVMGATGSAAPLRWRHDTKMACIFTLPGALPVPSRASSPPRRKLAKAGVHKAEL
jgi:hypothetical protein